MIQMISIADLHPHKDNPRKDLGDLSELTESIKVNGIFQNLTVTPQPGARQMVRFSRRARLSDERRGDRPQRWHA